MQLRRKSGLGNSSFLGGGSAFLVYAGLRLIRRGPPTLGILYVCLGVTSTNIEHIQNQMFNSVLKIGQTNIVRYIRFIIDILTLSYSN